MQEESKDVDDGAEESTQATTLSLVEDQTQDDTTGYERTTVGEETKGGKKKRKKRASKATVANRKAIQKNFMERCVSPSYNYSKKIQHNGQITLTNLREKAEIDAVYKNTRSKKKLQEWKAKMLAAPGRPPPSSIPPENNDNSEEGSNNEESS